MIPRHRLPLALFLLALCPVLAHQTRITTTAPLSGYTLTFFGDSGYPRALVEGATADLNDRDRIALTGVKLTLYTDDADQQIESILTAPDAVLEPETELVSGEGMVRLQREDLTVTGEAWTYDHAAKRIQIHRRAHIVFRAPLPDLLK